MARETQAFLQVGFDVFGDQLDEVLLLSWNQRLTFDGPDKNYNFLEVFSGRGRVSKTM